jgi:syntaxin 7
MGGLGEDGSLSLDEGLFVDQTMHERLIMQRLQPVNEAEVLSEIVQERNQEIGKLHKGIVEINEMFVDLSRIVGEQGLLIDSIWINLDEGNAKTKEGLVNIAKAASLQRGGNCVIS